MRTFFYFLLFTSLQAFSQTDKGWQQLFDGKTLNGWKQMTGNAEYKAENGAIVGATVMNSPNSFLVCDKRFTGDFVLELEAMMSDSNTNSGVQFKSNFNPSGSGRVYGYQFEMDP